MCSRLSMMSASSNSNDDININSTLYISWKAGGPIGIHSLLYHCRYCMVNATLNLVTVHYISPDEWTGGPIGLALLYHCRYCYLSYPVHIFLFIYIYNTIQYSLLNLLFLERILDKTCLVFWSNPWTNILLMVMVNMHIVLW